MTEPLFDAYLTGELTPGTTPDAAALRLAHLFKSKPEAMSKLLTGKPQLLKRGLTREAALKYRQALQQAGVAVAFRPQQTTAAEAVATEAKRPQAQPGSASFTLAPAEGELLRPEERRTLPTREIDVSRLTVAPAGSDVLAPEERATDVAAQVEPGAWSVAEPGAPLGPVGETPAPPPVSTGHLTLAPAEGELLQPDERRPPIPDYQLDEATGWQLEN